MKNIVLDSNDIKNKINRISFEIIEKNYDREEIILVGLLPNGRYISEEICKGINLNSNISTSIVYFNINKSSNEVSSEDSKYNFNNFNDKSVIVIDDVMNTGSTMIYALNKILNFSPYQIHENAEYDAAKEAQGLHELKISKLEDSLSNARIIDESDINTDKVSILSKVKIENIKLKKTFEYTIVSEEEANLQEKKLSVESPIGRGLLGKIKGEEVKVSIPSGEVIFKVIDISL